MSPLSKHNTGSIACVVDTETTFIAKNPRLVFHFGAVMGDLEQENQFKPYTMDYYVKEVMEDVENLLHRNSKGEAYGYNKALAKAQYDMVNNPLKIRKWKHIVEEWNDMMSSMGVNYLTSYNFNFDIGIKDKVGTIRKTHQQITDKTFYLPRGVDVCCLMDIAGTMFMNRNYRNFIQGLSEDDIQQMRTDKGNPKYSAEACMRFLNKDVYYKEQHTALRDSLLEFQLFSHFWRKWKATIKKDFVNDIRGVSLKNIKEGVSIKDRLKLRRGETVLPKKKKTKQNDPSKARENALQMEMPL